MSSALVLVRIRSAVGAFRIPTSQGIASAPGATLPLGMRNMT
jgi:hypothetical protein